VYVYVCVWIVIGCVYVDGQLDFLKEIYCAHNIYSVYKDKLQNCSCNQFK